MRLLKRTTWSCAVPRSHCNIPGGRRLWVKEEEEEEEEEAWVWPPVPAVECCGWRGGYTV